MTFLWRNDVTHRERAEIHECVDHQVEQDPFYRVGGGFGGRYRDQAQQHVTHWAIDE
jgi:hypothetical protein